MGAVRTRFYPGRLSILISGETVVRTKREPETKDEQEKRVKQDAQRAADAEDAIDAMIRRSIKLHGP